jgi:hypothetical protein
MFQQFVKASEQSPPSKFALARAKLSAAANPLSPDAWFI